MKTTELTREQIVEVAVASATNAADLLDDAELLLKAGRQARAHALGVLALEEIGKHAITVSGLVHAGDSKFWSRYWRTFHTHLLKLQHARFAVQLFGEWDEFDMPNFADRLKEWAASEHARKLTGLYVDLADDRAVIAPMEAITPEEAQRLLVDVRLLVEMGAFGSEQLRGAERERWVTFDAMVRSGGPPLTREEARQAWQQIARRSE